MHQVLFISYGNITMHGKQNIKIKQRVLYSPYLPGKLKCILIVFVVTVDVRVSM